MSRINPIQLIFFIFFITACKTSNLQNSEQQSLFILFEELSENELAKIYSQAQLKKQLMSHLLIILRNRKFIGMSINHIHQSFDIWINEENIPKDFLDKNFFENEINNIQFLKSNISRLKGITVKKMVDTIFTKNNIITWEI